jgi:hypothetical protein
MIAKLLVAIFVLIGLLHVYWAVGPHVGESAVVPSVDGKPLFQPSRLATVAVALALFGAAAMVAIRSGILSVPGLGFLAMIGCWGLVAVFGLRAIGDFRYLGFFKRVRGTRFARADTLVYSPLCALLAVMTAAVAAG